jgi:hypothetical protein
MIYAPQGMATSLPAAAPASSCTVTQAPPPASRVAAPMPAPIAGATLGSGALAAPLPSINVVPAPAPVPGVHTAPLDAGIPAAAPAAPAAAAAPAATTSAVTGANAAPRALTSVAPGGDPRDAALVEQTLATLRQSPSGAQVVDRLLAVNARVNVISDAEFQAMGHGDAHAFYDPKIDTMFLRRSDLSSPQAVQFAAVALAHEGTHLLDDVAGLSDAFIARTTEAIAAAGGLQTTQGAALRDQAMFELTMIKETRAFLFAGTVARELGMQLPDTDPTSTAIAGANDQATYAAVWDRLLHSGYNPERRTAAPRNL